VLRSRLKERQAAVLVLGTVAAAIPAIVHVLAGDINVHFTGTTHFYGVGFSALIAAAAAVGLTLSGRSAPTPER
jgi:hypothetical protein